MVLQSPDRLDEPAVVRSAVGGGLNGAEIAAAMLLREFGGHPIKLLPAARDGVPGVAEQPVGEAKERVGDLRRRQAAGALVCINLGGNRCEHGIDQGIWIGDTGVDEK